MIIYTEAPGADRIQRSRAAKGSKAYDRWPAIEKDMIQRADQKIAIAKTAKP